MEKEQIAKTVIFIVTGALGLEEEDVNINSNLQYDLGADSLDVVEIVMECEKEFNVSLPDSKVENIERVDELVEILFKAKN